MVAKARPGEMLATSVVRDLVVGSEIEFADRGARELKGVPGVWSLLAVANVRTASGRWTVPRVARKPLALARLLGRLRQGVDEPDLHPLHERP